MENPRTLQDNLDALAKPPSLRSILLCEGGQRAMVDAQINTIITPRAVITIPNQLPGHVQDMVKVAYGVYMYGTMKVRRDFERKAKKLHEDDQEAILTAKLIFDRDWRLAPYVEKEVAA